MQDYYKARGRVFDIQKYSIHDGTGIRTIVFLKGCGLRCLWCCNPEGQRYEKEVMMFNGEEKPVGNDMTVEEVLEIIRQDKLYYVRSNGGVTLSGGECLLQPDFGPHILHASKDYGFNTAIETAGFAKWENVEKYLPYTDTFLMDIKNMNSEKHKRFTSQPNELILENAKKIASSKQVKLIIRVPVIPTFNNTPEEIKAISEFAASLPGVEEMHLLPYHRLGQDKYTWLGRDYKMKDENLLSQELMQKLLDTARLSGLNCRIGG